MFAATANPPAFPAFARRAGAILPGLALCIGVTLVARGLDWAETRWLGRDWLETLVLAILVGTAVRTAWTPSQRWMPGINFSAKLLLEIAVVLLGASLSAAAIAAIGPVLLVGIAIVVMVSIIASFTIGRMLGLPVRMALLVACGNSICGNSAIAAIAPVIGADGDDVAASIAFTAVLGVAVVLGLPFLGAALGMKATAYGALAGLTVYAVPQVLAASAPMGATAVQTGTLVKLVRVLMLGPVSLVLALLAPRLPAPANAPVDDVVAGGQRKPGRPSIGQLVPWFILGFLGLAALRSFGLVPTAAIAPANEIAGVLTILSMAALGLGVDIRTVAKAGGPVTGAVILSLVVLGGISLALVHFASVG